MKGYKNGGTQFLSRGAKIKKKSPPAGKFGIVFGLLGFKVLVFKKMAVSPAFLGDFDEVRIVSFLILIHIETLSF